MMSFASILWAAVAVFAKGETAFIPGSIGGQNSGGVLPRLMTGNASVQRFLESKASWLNG
jgi:hypothetical protein